MFWSTLYQYFKNVDAVVKAARDNNLVILMTVFHQSWRNNIPFDKARAWAKWLATRYAAAPNVIWSTTPEAKQESVPILREIAAGLREGDPLHRPISFEPDPAPAPSSSLFATGGKTEGRVLRLAARHRGGQGAMVYLGDQAEFSVDLGKLSAAKLNALWISPADGKVIPLGPLSNQGVKSFTTPDGWEDSLLVLESPDGPGPVFPLKVSAKRRYLVDSNGKPFFVMGDTPWFIQKLKIEDVRMLMDDRVAKGWLDARCFWKKSQIVSVALILSERLPTMNSGNRLLPPAQVWPSSSTVMYTTSTPPRPGRYVSVRMPLVSEVLAGVSGQPTAFAHFRIESRTGGLGFERILSLPPKASLGTPPSIKFNGSAVPVM